MSQNFRHQARQTIARAKSLLSGDDVKPEQLRYAALDARMAMEALTYERAHSYRKELPESAYGTWQPRKLMQVLLDIDPDADKDRTLSVGLEETYGIPAKEMNSLGKETVLNLSILKKHYDALGSYLHRPTLKQLQADEVPSFEKLKRRLEGIIAYVDTVLESPIFTINFGTFSTARCSRCEAEIRWRIPRNAETLEAVCRECDAPYDLVVLEDSQTRWNPRQHPVKCAHTVCSETSFMWEDQIEPGTAWICSACEGHNHMVLMNRAVMPDSIPPSGRK